MPNQTRNADPARLDALNAKYKAKVYGNLANKHSGSGGNIVCDCPCGAKKGAESRFSYHPNTGMYRCWHENACTLTKLTGNALTLAKELGIYSEGPHSTNGARPAPKPADTSNAGGGQQDANTPAVSGADPAPAVFSESSLPDSPPSVVQPPAGKPPNPRSSHQRPAGGGAGSNGRGQRWDVTAEWVYKNAQGFDIAKKVRYRKPDGDKAYSVLHYDGDRWQKGIPASVIIPLYNGHMIPKASRVWFVEGEKCADRLNKLLLDEGKLGHEIATTIIYGADKEGGKWKTLNDKFSYTAQLRGKEIIAIPDNDAPGFGLMREVLSTIKGTGIFIPGLSAKQDVYDYIEAGAGYADLVGLVRKAKRKKPHWVTGEKEEEQASFENMFANEQLREILLDEYDFRYNIMLGATEYKHRNEMDWKQFGDRDLNSIWYWVTTTDFDPADFSKMSEKKILQIIQSRGIEDYHPVQDYLSALPEWDGKTEYIRELSNKFKIKTQMRTDASGHERPYPNAYLYFARWMIGAVACGVDSKKNESIMVLTGARGTGKTSFWETLCPLKDHYATPTTFNPANKDHKIRMQTNWIIQFDELAALEKTDIRALKAATSADRFAERKPYGKLEERMNRHASFCGCTNERQFLSDISGNRRWLVLHVLEIDWKTITQELVHHCWAEAYARYRLGQKYWFDGTDIDDIEATGAEYELEIFEETLIREWFEESLGGSLSTTEIFEHLAEKSKESAKKLSLYRIGAVLHKLGYEKKTEGRGTKRWQNIMKRPS